MQTIDLFQEKKDCCGCELCAAICPKSVIKIEKDTLGFSYPIIYSDHDCINCKKCLKICPEKSAARKAEDPIECYGGHVKVENEIKKSSSGGIATAISRRFIEKYKGIVYGVAYDNNFNDVKYKRAESLYDLIQFRTSKYVQAEKGSIYSKVLSDLKEGRKVLFIGLPCEISAVYHSVGKYSNQLYTISLICHGPTSISVHQEYCSELKKKFGSQISSFSVRHKLKGWKPYYIHAEFEDGKEFNTEFATSEYDIAFKYMKRESCGECKYKLGNPDFGIVSDLTLGDFHAVQVNEKSYNKWGSSEILVHTNKGKDLLESIHPDVCLEQIPIERVKSGNIALYDSVRFPKNRPLFISTYVNEGLRKACRKPQVYFPILKKYYTKLLKLKIRNFINSILNQHL